jgi:hypothetical protein
VHPPALTIFYEPPLSAALVKCFALKKWSQRFQWGGMPRYPSHMAVKMAACAMELGLK